ncbi:MAG: hypothetical protein KAI50_02170 [Desulfobacterales bacterium]|nr:hypothetical protein [Desulfobacterales bacterium]
MAQTHTQISAYISEETKNIVERYARARGVKKGFLVESALLHHLQILEKLPADVIIPPRLVVSRKSGETILEQLEKPFEPTEKIIPKDRCRNFSNEAI